MNVEAFKWLNGKPPQQWSRSHFSTWLQCDILLNNLCESFNAAILEARDKPLITMLEKIRRILMRRTHVLRDKMIKCKGLLCPKIQAIVEKIKTASTHCTPSWPGSPKFEVLSRRIQYVVDIDNKTCSCRRWDLTGIPCTHAVSALCCKGLKVEEFVADWYKRDLYIKTYNNTVDPIHGPEMWLKTGLPPIIPPISRKKAGRPKKLRRKELDENQAVSEVLNQGGGSAEMKLGRKGGTVTCSYCKVLGHNIRICPSKPIEVANEKKKSVTCSICKKIWHNKRKCPSTKGFDQVSFSEKQPIFEQVQEEHVTPEIQSQITQAHKTKFCRGDDKIMEGTSQSKKKMDEVNKGNNANASQSTVNIGKVQIGRSFMKKGQCVVTLGSLHAAANKRSGDLQ